MRAYKAQKKAAAKAAAAPKLLITVIANGDAGPRSTTARPSSDLLDATGLGGAHRRRRTQRRRADHAASIRRSCCTTATPGDREGRGRWLNPTRRPSRWPALLSVHARPARPAASSSTRASAAASTSCSTATRTPTPGRFSSAARWCATCADRTACRSSSTTDPTSRSSWAPTACTSARTTRRRRWPAGSSAPTPSSACRPITRTT